MNQLLKRIVRVRTVDNGTIGVFVVGGLGTEFAPKEFVDLSGRAMQARGNIGNVWNDSLDTVSRSFDFSIDGRHFVAIFRIIDRSSSGNVDNCSSANRHGELCLCTNVLNLASIESYIYFFLPEGIVNGLLRDEMVLRGSDGTNASVNSGIWDVNKTF